MSRWRRPGAMGKTRRQSYFLGVAAYRAPANYGLTCEQCWKQFVTADGRSDLYRSEFWRGWYHAADGSLTYADLARMATLFKDRAR